MGLGVEWGGGWREGRVGSWQEAGVGSWREAGSWILVGGKLAGSRGGKLAGSCWAQAAHQDLKVCLWTCGPRLLPLSSNRLEITFTTTAAASSSNISQHPTITYPRPQPCRCWHLVASPSPPVLPPTTPFTTTPGWCHLQGHHHRRRRFRQVLSSSFPPASQQLPIGCHHPAADWTLKGCRFSHRAPSCSRNAAVEWNLD